MPRIAVCFVCTGNICRSPTADGVMRALVAKALLDDHIEVDSAGTISYHEGELPDSRARRIAKARGYALEHRARQIRPHDYHRFDYLIAMDAGHQSFLTRGLPAGARAKLVLLRDFDATAERGSDVPDPYYGEDEGFESVLTMCERACAGLLEHLRRTHELP